jgi:hypothetical protein
MTHLPLRRTRAEGHHLQRELRQVDRCRQGTTSHVQFLLSNQILPIGYVDLYRHDFARQSIAIFMIHCYDLSRTYGSNTLVMFMIYP